MDKEGIRRIFVEKKEGFNVEAREVLEDLKNNLLIKNLSYVKIINRYDVTGIDDNVYKKAKNTIFSEPQVDKSYDEEYIISEDEKSLVIEYLPGQFDQRADSLVQCLQILMGEDTPLKARTAKLYVLGGNISNDEFEKIKKYLINPVETREAETKKPVTLEIGSNIIEKVKSVDGFINMGEDDLKQIYKQYGFAMDLNDLLFCQKYFKDEEKRDPTITEMKMIDTYWSDHCRHTTFLTKIEEANISWDLLNEIFKEYKASREYVYGDKEKDISLMDIATIAMKELKKQGKLKDLDESDEINACSFKTTILVDGEEKEYLIMFKNETHNHPTEIEPFGGAATCLGGAIRDPLSGRAYVYQAMRITGAGDPTVAVEKTLQNKLPQSKITTTAAAGYSSYGNQIGLCTGQVREIYHPGYVAKRMELGAVVAMAPKENVIRLEPIPGDIVILLGGKTGRDGCGGATGSSKAHDSSSLTSCGAEVQKGNAPEERKIQRLFRNKEVTTMIKRCNDFGAGGVSVAIGELADGLEIYLDKIPKKYDGLNGTELAISESQERMAVVIAKENLDRFMSFVSEENLEATYVADVVEEKRVKIHFMGDTIVNVSREFLNTNGNTKNTNVKVEEPKNIKEFFVPRENVDIKQKWINSISNLNACSQKGLAERFDGSIGASTIFMPFGGKYQLTPSDVMAAKLPILEGNTDNGTVMSYGYDPYLSEKSPFHGAVYAIVESVSKYVAAGGDYKKAWLSLQEYFEKLRDEDIRWGKPFAALLGAYHAQRQLGIAAIGGKDSMSGSFNELDVPPTLVSFCIGPVDTKKIISNEFKKTNSKVGLIKLKLDENNLPNFDELKKTFDKIHTLINEDKVIACMQVTHGGLAETITKMCMGNKIGFEFDLSLNAFEKGYGSFVLEIPEGVTVEGIQIIGNTTEERVIKYKDIVLQLDELIKAWEEPLEKIFPTRVNQEEKRIENVLYNKKGITVASTKFAKPRVLIPVFPGSNSEYDLQRAFTHAGGEVNTVVFKNLTSNDIRLSLAKMEEEIKKAQIIMIPGGFSAGDEPDGSGKFIATIFRNELIKEALHKQLYEHDALMLGICNGFQAVLKLGLVPGGKIIDMNENSPTLALNTIGRLQSKLVTTKVVSKLSPWFNKMELGEEIVLPIAHGEGRFIANDETIKQLIQNGQIATQYVDELGNATYDINYNPNGSTYAVEGITSPDGRILGKMGHPERCYEGRISNVPGNYNQKLFESGIEYFK